MIRQKILISCTVTAELHVFIEKLRMYYRVTDIKEGVITAIERDILDIKHKIEAAANEHPELKSNPSVEQYLSSLTSFYKYTHLEKTFHRYYLRKFILQSTEFFYTMMLTDLFNSKKESDETVGELFNDYFFGTQVKSVNKVH